MSENTSARVLIIDDDEHWRDWCKRHLSMPSMPPCDITTASRHTEAITQIENNTFDLVILNIKLEEERDSKTVTVAFWTELLDLIKQRNSKTVILTSESHPTVKIHNLMRVAFVDYKSTITDFLIKEEVRVKEYRQLVRDIFKERGKNGKTDIQYGHRQVLIDSLINLPEWSDGQHQERRGTLSAFLPNKYVHPLGNLSGLPEAKAAQVIDSLARFGFMPEHLSYTPLCLLVKYLFKRSDIETRKLLTEIVFSYHMTTDANWLDELDQFKSSWTVV